MANPFGGLARFPATLFSQRWAPANCFVQVLFNTRWGTSEDYSGGKLLFFADVLKAGFPELLLALQGKIGLK